jgi:hypothetical protein
MRGEEVLIRRYVGGGCRCSTSAGREARTARTHRQSARGKARILELRMAHRVRVHVTRTEFPARDAGRAAEVPVMHRQVHIRETVAAMQRSKTTAVKFTPSTFAKAPTAPASPPRMEMVTRP